MMTHLLRLNTFCYSVQSNNFKNNTQRLCFYRQEIHNRSWITALLLDGLRDALQHLP